MLELLEVEQKFGGGGRIWSKSQKLTGKLGCKLHKRFRKLGEAIKSRQVKTLSEIVYDPHVMGESH